MMGAAARGADAENGYIRGLRRVFLKNQVSFMKIARNLFLRRL